MTDALVVLAGATGNLGGRIARVLRERGARVRALVRPGAAAEKVERLRALEVDVVPVDLSSVAATTEACAGAACVVSALAGLRDVIVDRQSVLLEAAVAAGVPRFIPSDYSIDFTKFPAGQNRNLDLRREFHTRLDAAKIAATTIFCGAFADMLTGQMPLILYKRKRILYWGNADQRMDFTTVDDTAAFTARAALDPSTPRFLRVAGDERSAREMADVVSEVAGTKFGLLWAGPLGMLSVMSKIGRVFAPAREDLYPAWQGMQYMFNMLDGKAKLAPLDNDRYPDLRWTSAREVVAAHLAGATT